MNKTLLTTLTFLSMAIQACGAGYEPIVTCEANYRQAPYEMKCWSEKLGRETTIGEFLKALKSGRIAR